MHVWLPLILRLSPPPPTSYAVPASLSLSKQETPNGKGKKGRRITTASGMVDLTEKLMDTQNNLVHCILCELSHVKYLLFAQGSIGKKRKENTGYNGSYTKLKKIEENSKEIHF